MSSPHPDTTTPTPNLEVVPGVAYFHLGGPTSLAWRANLKRVFLTKTTVLTKILICLFLQGQGTGLTVLTVLAVGTLNQPGTEPCHAAPDGIFRARLLAEVGHKACFLFVPGFLPWMLWLEVRHVCVRPKQKAAYQISKNLWPDTLLKHDGSPKWWF